MIDIYEAVEDKITDALRAVNKLDGQSYLVQPSHQGGAEPSESYLSVFMYDLYAVREVKSGRYELHDEAGNQFVREHIVSHYSAKVQLSFIGPEAGKFSTNRYSNMFGGLVLHEFHKQGISPTRKSSLRRNPQLRGTKWVNDFVFDLTVSFAVITTDDTTEWVEDFTILGNTSSIK